MTFAVRAVAFALFVSSLLGCGSSDNKESAPKAAANASPASNGSSTEVNLDSLPVDPITIEDFFKEKAVAKYIGKRVTWKCVLETVGDYEENPPGFSATGFPVEFEGLKEPTEDKENITEYSKCVHAYAQAEIARVGQTVTFSFDDRESHEKLKNAKGKRASISGIVAASPINNSADLNHCRVMSVEN